MAIGAALVCAPGAAAAPRPLAIGSVPQLFVDDHLVAEQSGLRRVQTRPGGGRVVLTNDRPWEQRIFYPEVVETADGYRMYYNAALADDPSVNVISLAESVDGLTFQKPDLGRRIGSWSTNAVLADAVGGHGEVHGPAVRFDGDSPAARRWRLAYGLYSSDMRVAFSEDGRRFRPWDGNPVGRNKCDTKQSVVWDPDRKVWVWFTRLWEPPRDGRTGWRRFGGDIRSVARSESRDFVTWSKPEAVIRREPSDPALCDFYGLQVTMRHGVMIGLLWTSDWDDEDGRIGRQRAQLVTSRDGGRSWTRPDPAAMWFELGSSGGFDSEIVWPTSILTRGDKDLVYYQGANIPHASRPVSEFPPDAYRIGVRSLPRDRFAGLRAAARGGRVTTVPLLVPQGARLRLNADVRPGGQIRVSASRPGGAPLISSSAPVFGDRLDAPVSWAGRERLPYGPVQLTLTLSDATLYGLRLA